MTRRIAYPATLLILLLAACPLRAPGPAEPPPPVQEAPGEEAEPAASTPEEEPSPEQLLQLAEVYFAEAMTDREEGREEEADQAMEAALETLLHGQEQFPDDQRLQRRYCWILDEVARSAEPEPDPHLPKDELPDLDEPDGALEAELPEVEILGEIPREMNRQIANCIEYFSGKKRGVIARALSRGSAYMPMIHTACQAKGIPPEIGLLPVIESAFNPRARSYARANGMWQFIASTGRAYGLEIDWWCDDRLDPMKSTEAALNHLRDLYERFGSWHLALAAYNAGERRVSRAVKRAGTSDFWEISRRRLLPRQTRNYVPAFIAAVTLADDPGKYGLDVSPQPPYEFDEVTLEDQTELRVAAECAGTNVQELQRLNPDILRGVTPPRSSYVLKIPRGTRDRFVAEYAKVPRDARAVWKRHVVRQGDNLWKLARRYGTTESAIRRANGMGNRSMIHVGRSLLIPSVIDHGSPGRGSVCPPPESRTPPPGSSRTVYRIRRGDTLGSIARRFGVRTADLRRWNGIRGSRILAGENLVIYHDGHRSQATGSSGTIPVPEGGLKYRVRRGDSLWSIARAHGVTVEQLRHWNRLGHRSRIHPGQELWIQPGEDASPATSEPPPGVSRTYVVRRGDSLWSIARAHGVTVGQLRNWNGLGRRSTLHPGQSLKVGSAHAGAMTSLSSGSGSTSSEPEGSGDAAAPSSEVENPRQYVVRRGDSLWSIAQAHGVTVEQLRAWNGLGRSSTLHPGQELIVSAH